MLVKILKIRDYNRMMNLVLLVLRVLIAVLMLTHGTPKLQNLLSGNLNFSDPLGLGSSTSLILTVFSEFLCSILIAAGLLTRLAVIPLIITMMVIMFVVHGADSILEHYNVLIYLLGYLTLLVSGSGRYSLDYFLFKRK